MVVMLIDRRLSYAFTFGNDQNHAYIKKDNAKDYVGAFPLPCDKKRGELTIMRKIKNIARPCGDCWTADHRETLSFKAMCWADAKGYDKLANLLSKAAFTDWSAIGLIAAICAICMSIGIAIGAQCQKNMGRYSPYTGTYPQALKVVDVKKDAQSYIVTFETATGISYTLVSEDGDFMAGEIYAAIMHNMGTRDISDDKILNLKYTGFDNKKRRILL